MMNLLDSEVVSTTEPMTHAEVNKRLSAMVNLMAGNPLAIAIANGRDLPSVATVSGASRSTTTRQ